MEFDDVLDDLPRSKRNEILKLMDIGSPVPNPTGRNQNGCNSRSNVSSSDSSRSTSILDSGLCDGLGASDSTPFNWLGLLEFVCRFILAICLVIMGICMILLGIPCMLFPPLGLWIMMGGGYFIMLAGKIMEMIPEGVEVE